jgi:hypothetical protein
LSGSGINDNKTIEGNNPGVSNTMSNSNMIRYSNKWEKNTNLATSYHKQSAISMNF